MASAVRPSPYAPGPRQPGPAASAPPGRAPARSWRDLDPVTPDQELLLRHGAVVLDPLTAVRAPGRPRPRPTVYVADSLIVRAEIFDDDRLLERLQHAARGEGARIARPGDSKDGRDGSAGAGPAWLPADVVRLEPASDTPSAPDAWAVLQRFRALSPGDPKATAGVGLNHLLFGEPHVAGHPVTGLPHVAGHSVTEPDGLAEYAMAGSGGRAPVSWLGDPPDHDSAFTGRRPVVAVLDTGCGEHPWFGEGVTRDLVFDGVRAGSVDPATDPEITGDLVGPMDGALDTHSGHGTFITGLIRQISPRADVLALRVMGSDGVVEEGDLVRALAVLERVVAASLAGGASRPAVDIVSLSLGYYHEAPEDAAYDSVLLTQLDALGQQGVAVLAGAGNDATVREMYPAAFLPHPGGVVPAFLHSQVPVVSVGALNPDGTIALFSNGGDWVATWEVGAALVSTFPTTFNGGVQPTVVLPTAVGRPRSTIDPDSFRGGFGTWSGTSFSTPVLAARLARALDQQAETLSALDPVSRMWAILTEETGLQRPPA